MAHPHGMFTWADLACPEPEAAADFYGKVLGWTYESLGEEAGGYGFFRHDGKLAAGVGKLSDEQQQAGQPPAWSNYANVDDVDQAAKKASELGATVFLEPMDVMTAGRMAFLSDPTGAVIGLWQPGDHTGADAYNDPGFMTWNELATRDVAKAKSFYGEVLGWTFNEEDFGPDAEYHTILVGDRPNGGLYPMPPQMPAEVPSHWAVYFRVANADAALETATSAGARPLGDPNETPFGKMAAIADPWGARLVLAGPAPDQG